MENSVMEMTLEQRCDLRGIDAWKISSLEIVDLDTCGSEKNVLLVLKRGFFGLKKMDLIFSTSNTLQINWGAYTTCEQQIRGVCLEHLSSSKSRIHFKGISCRDVETGRPFEGHCFHDRNPLMCLIKFGPEHKEDIYALGELFGTIPTQYTWHLENG